MRQDDALIEAEIPGLRRYAFALTRDRGEADDLVQDCLEHAVRGWPSRRPQDPVRPWLFAIMHNVFVSGLRKRARRGLWASLTDLHSEPAVQARQEDPIRYRDVLKAIEQLTVDQRSVVLLVGVEEFSYTEAAGILGWPIGTVMSRLSRGRERLRELLGEAPRPGLRRIK